MTAIGRLFIDGRPLVIGDVAISGPEPGDDAEVPSIGPIHDTFPPGSGYTVCGALQKVVVCHDRLVVAWSGPVVAASSLLRELSALKDPSIDDSAERPT